MIIHAYITRIGRENGSFGFAETEDSKSLYIPGQVVETFDLTQDDMGYLTKFHVMEDRGGRSDYIATSVLVDKDDVTQQNKDLLAEVSRLEGILDDHNISY